MGLMDLRNAINKNDVEAVKEALKKINYLVDNSFELGQAAAKGYTDIVKILLEDGRFINGDSALIFAVQNGHTETVKVLLEDSNIYPGYKKNLAIRTAAERGYTEIVRILLLQRYVNPSDENNEAIIEAAKGGHVEIVKLLLTNPYVKPTADNNYPLIMASNNGHIDVVKVLLSDRRVDPSFPDNIAIKVAAKGGYIEIVKLLLEDPRVDWRVIQDDPIIQKILNKNNIDIESRLSQSYLTLKQAGEEYIVKDIRKKVSELGVYKGFYEEYCSNIPDNLKIPPMKLILIADKLGIKYNKTNIEWAELCAKVKMRLDHLLD